MSHTAPSRTARAPRASAFLAALTLALLAATAPAHAGEYKVYNCNPPGHTVPGASLGDWRFEATPGRRRRSSDARVGAVSRPLPGTS